MIVIEWRGPLHGGSGEKHLNPRDGQLLVFNQDRHGIEGAIFSRRGIEFPEACAVLGIPAAKWSIEEWGYWVLLELRIVGKAKRRKYMEGIYK